MTAREGGDERRGEGGKERVEENKRHEKRLEEETGRGR